MQKTEQRNITIKNYLCKARNKIERNRIKDKKFKQNLQHRT